MRSTTDLIGTIIDTYQIQSVLGKGGMGVVYKAIDTSLEKVVALKMMHPMLVEDERFLRRFKSEAKALGRLHHPHIVNVFAFRHVEQHLFIVMEFVDGGTVTQRIRRHGPVPWREARPIMQQSLSAIDYAHQQKIIHRDIKPHNLLLAGNDFVKVTDFGLAKIQVAQTDSMAATRTGFTGGTLYYMPPEQLEGLPNVDHRGDIYALGMTFYEMLAGRTPFEKTSSEFAILKAIDAHDFPSLDEVKKGVPGPLVQIVMKAIEREPQDRYQSAAEMLAALDAWREEEMPDAPDDTMATTMLIPKPVLPPTRRKKSKPTFGSAFKALVRKMGGSSSKARAGQPARREPPSQASRAVAKSAPKTPPQSAPIGRTTPEPKAAPPSKVAQPPKDEPPKVEPKATPLPKLESAKAEPPKVEPPKAESPKPEPPKAESPKPEPPKVEPKAAPKPAAIPAAKAAPEPRQPATPVAKPREQTPVQGARARPDRSPTPKTSPPPKAQPRKRSLPMPVLLGAGLMLAVLLFLGGRQVFGPDEAGATTSLSIASVPDAVTVSVDGIPVGATPLTDFVLRPGVHTFRLESPGFAPFDTSITLQADEAPGFTFRLQTLSLTDEGITDPDSLAGGEGETDPDGEARFGPLTIASQPSRAKVWVDGQYVGETPFTQNRLATGRHRVVVRKDGFEEYSRSIDVTEGGRNALTASLSPLTANVRIIVRPFGNIYINGTLKAEGTNAPHTENLSYGTYSVRATHPVLGRWEKRITLNRPGTHDVLFNFNDEFKVLVTSEPRNAEVIIDGEATRKFTPVQVTVRPGRHTITVRRRGHEPDGNPRVLDVEGDQTSQPVHFILKKKGFLN